MSILKLVETNNLTAVAELDNSIIVGFKPLIIAAKLGYLEMVKLLISKGAKIRAKDEDGCNALYYAACYNQSAVVDFLITRGANVNHRCDDGNTPLLAACTDGNFHHEVIKVLIKHGAKFNIDSSRGERTPKKQILAIIAEYDAKQMALSA